MRHFFTRLTKHFFESRAAITVETALIAPIFILFLGLLLETARLSIAYSVIDNALFSGTMQAKAERGVNAQTLIRQKLEDAQNGLFSAEDIKLTVTYSDSLKNLANGAGQSGGGRGNALVHVKADIDLSLLKGFMPKALQAHRTVDFFYINEPDY